MLSETTSRARDRLRRQASAPKYPLTPPCSRLPPRQRSAARWKGLQVRVLRPVEHAIVLWLYRACEQAAPRGEPSTNCPKQSHHVFWDSAEHLSQKTGRPLHNPQSLLQRFRRLLNGFGLFLADRNERVGVHHCALSTRSPARPGVRDPPTANLHLPPPPLSPLPSSPLRPPS